MGARRIRIAFAIPASADAAWDAVHTPAVAAALYRPLMKMAPLPGAWYGALPQRFVSGDQIDVALRIGGIIPIGTQRIAITDAIPERRPAGARTMRDAGRPLSGPLALLTGWNHEITVWPRGPQSAVWEDELTIDGALAPLFALALRPMWRWRRRKLTRLARHWS